MLDGRVNVLNVIRHPYGGIRSYLRYNYARLDPGRYRVGVVTVAHPEAAVLRNDLAPIETTLSLVPPKGAFVNLMRRTRAMLRTADFQVIHSQGLTAAVAAGLANIPRRLPHIVTLHETLREEQFGLPFGAAKRRVLTQVLRRADRVILVGEDALANLRTQLPHTPSTRLEVIRNGVWVEAIARDAAVPRTPLKTTGIVRADATILGFVGRFMPEKGFPVLVDAVDRLRREAANQLAFQVVAVNDGAYVREYRRDVEQRGLREYFAFLGLQPSVAGLLTEFDAVVVPSLREACPLVAMEALVLGCPLVASDCIGLREVTRGSPAFVSTSGDAASLADALRLVVRAPAEAKKAALDYSEAARRLFDSSQTAARLDNLFQQLLAGVTT